MAETPINTVLYGKDGDSTVPLYPQTVASQVSMPDENGNASNVSAEVNALRTKIRSECAPLASPSFTGTPTAPTQSSGDSSTKIATTAFVQAAVSTGGGSFLPLSGGTLTGSILFNSYGLVGADTEHLTMLSGDGWSNRGAYAFLMKKDASSNAGDFVLAACNGTNTKLLRGTPAGALTWGSGTVAMVSDLSSYLPLSGGTMSGPITRNNAVVQASGDASYTQYYGGTSSSDGAYMILTGANNANYSGAFVLRAVGTGGGYSMLGEPTGGLKWGGIEIERVRNTSGKYIKFESGVLVCWGIAQATSSGVAITFGDSFKDNSEPVVFTCAMNTATTSSYSSRSATGFTLKANNTTATWVSWLAIGRWK